MIKSQAVAEFLKKHVGKFGIFSIVLVALEQMLDDDFVCPCEVVYNRVIFVLYCAVPSFGCFIFTFCFMDQFPETEDGQMRNSSMCMKCLYSILTATVWLFVFFFDGRYLACLCSDWKGVYTKTDPLGIVRWCKPTGNETSVFESQHTTLMWMSRSQVSPELKSEK